MKFSAVFFETGESVFPFMFLFITLGRSENL